MIDNANRRWALSCSSASMRSVMLGWLSPMGRLLFLVSSWLVVGAEAPRAAGWGSGPGGLSNACFDPTERVRH
jgi:hypothetical protein